MSSLFGIGGNSASTEFYPYLLERSLRFDANVNSRLQRTLTSTTNRKTFTWSGWVKRGALGSGQGIFGTATGATANFFIMQFLSDNTLFIQQQISSSENIRLGTDRLFRDTSAWYNIVLAVDTTQSTASDRLKLYINGDLTTDFSSGNATYPSSQDLDTAINNSSYPISVGSVNTGTIQSLDGYLAEVHFIDGTALTSSSFGQTKEGIWIPKQYTGSHGTNGFYLNFTDSTTAAGFSSVAYTGPIPDSAVAGTTGTVSGVGFQPDLVWIKNRTNANDHQWFDTVRGTDSSGDQALQSNRTFAESTSNSNGGVSSIDADGFTVKAGTDVGGRSNLTGSDAYNYISWNWQAGGAPTADNSAGAGNTPTANSVKIDGSNLGSALAGTIPATRLSANTTYGFSIVTYTGTGANGATVAHGLGSAPKMIFIKSRVATSADGNWLVYAKAGTVDETDYLLLNSTALATDEAGAFNDTAATSTVFSLGTFADLNESGKTYVAYCWTDISSYSAIGGYTGNGSSGHAITTGFAPAWLMVKRVDPTGSVNSWYIVDNTRTANMASGNDDLLFPNLPNIEGSTNDFFSFTSTGFTLNTSSPAVNTSGGEYIYMAFKDTRTNAFFRDQSGNANNFAATGLEYTDSKPDLPTNNFAVWLPTYADVSSINNVTLSEGNLKVAGTGANFDISALSFVLPKSGKWYFEYTIGGQFDGWGFCKLGAEGNITGGAGLGNLSTAQGGGIQQTGWYNSTSVTTNFGIGNFTAGQIHQVAIDVDGGKLYYGVNNTYYAADGGSDGNPSSGTNPLSTFDFAGNEIKLMTQVTGGGGAATSVAENWNFGQNGTFNNTKIAQGNSDVNGIGDFFYAPPTDFLALCTDNLPNPGIDPNRGDDPEEYFNSATYTGNGSGQSITGIGFQPDFIWFKSRSASSDHALFDSIRGINSGLSTNTSLAANTTATSSQDLVSFDSDGFTVGASSQFGSVNASSEPIVAWNWKAGGTAVSNDDGDVTSSVSASPESGFSIVTYTATGSGDITVGHGLGVAPELIFGKVRNQAYGWTNFALPAGSDAVSGFVTNAPASGSDNVAYGKTAPTSSVFTAGRGSTDNMNFGSGNTVVAYCFASIEGYSKIGSYTGVGGADNSFIYLGFKPAWFLIKRLNSTGDWVLYDNKRDPFNVGSNRISPNLSNAELTGASNYGIDFVSNGVKLRSGQADTAVSGGTYIYMAFAEQPFKYANAR